MKIKHKLIFGFISITLFVIIVVGYFSVNTGQKALQKTIGTTSALLTTKMLEHIDRHICNRIEFIQCIAKDPITQRVVLGSNRDCESLHDIQNYIKEKDLEWTSTPKEEKTVFMQDLINNELSEQLREKISFFKEKYGCTIFGEIFVTNKYGANAAQSGKTSDYYQADEQWWQNARKDLIYVGEVEYDESADIYSTDICIRIDDENGDFAGVVKAVLNIKETTNFIKKAEEEKEEITTREFKLLSRDGKVIYATEEYEFLKPLPEELLLYFDKDKEYEHGAYFISAGDKAGEEAKVFAYAHSKGHKDYKGLGWTLVVEYETEEIFASVAKLKNRILTISIAITVLAVIISLVISRSISRPLGKLSVVVAKIGKGELDSRIEIESNDEVGQFAASFNKMAEDLETTTTSIDNLNHEIAERKKTEELLQASNQQLQSEITERKQIEKELSEHRVHLEELVAQRTTSLEKSNEKLARSNTELREFVYIASHDLREPLRKISSFGELVKDSLGEGLEENDKENLDFMIDGAERMTQMIEALLVYSRLNTKDITLSTVDLNEIIEQFSLLELATLLEETKATIEVPQSLPIVKADKVLVRQLMQNLISNGIKYQKPGTAPRIEITARQIDNDKVRIEFKDNGIGIKKEMHQTIFKMFKRVHSREEYQGTGIGLAVCKKIAERHGSQIGVDSEEGKGSVFWFTMSLEKELATVS